MTTTGGKSKPRSRGKSKSASSSEADPKHTSARKGVHEKGSRRQVAAVIRKLDVTSLRDDDLVKVLDHCASALNLRRMRKHEGERLAKSMNDYCYTKSGSSSTVSIWSGGFKVGEMSEADAKAREIPSCG